MADTTENTGTGTDSLEVRKIDPNAGRKAIIARHNALQQADFEIDQEQVPGAKTLQSGYEEKEGAASTDGDTAGDSAMQSQRAPEPVETAAEPVVASPATAEAAAAPETVTLKVFGKEVVEPRDVVDAAGGVEARQAQLAAQVRFTQAEELARRAQDLSRIAADKKRQYETQLTQMTVRPGQPAAPTQARPADSEDSRSGAETAAATGETDRLIDGVVTALYDGDPDRAKKALAEVLKNRPVEQHSDIDVSKISALVQAKVDADLAARDADNAVEQQRRDVNELMSTQYAGVLNDPVLRADCAHLYNAAIADPRNQGRPWMVIADEVAQRVLGRAGHVDARPNADIQQEVNTRTNFKRRIPAPSQATERVPAQAAEPKYPTKPADIVNLMRAARHQPLQ